MENVLPALLSSLPHQVHRGLEQVMEEAQAHRQELVAALMKDTRCNQYISVLCSLLEAPDTRLCSNVAYILGTLAEDPEVAELLVEIVRCSKEWDLLGRLGAMLLWKDTEAVMNAAGALGTLAESSHGRRWLLSYPDSNFIIENITSLLGSQSDWTASNCALVLARICMCHEGCDRILAHPKCQLILRNLIASLHVDEAGCGLNAAFALGRICDTDAGRRQVMSLQDADNMVAALESMMSGGDAGGSRNACFALTCLANDQAGHQHILRSEHFPRVLDSLCRLLLSEDQESCWFAAMTLKVLSSYPQGVVRLRQNQLVESTLKTVARSHTAGHELLEEVENTIKNLQRLPQPPAPKTKILEPDCVWVGWKEHRPNSGLPVTYSLFDGGKLLYHGLACSYMLRCKPGQQHHFKVVMETEGDRSPESPVTVLMREVPPPSCPLDFQVIGHTATQLKLSWSPPADPGVAIKGYVVFQEGMPVETTTDLSCIVGGLTPSSSYTFSVCACTSGGEGPKVSLIARTMDRGDHAPGKLTLYVIGRSEIFITWEVPKAPLGRFFNYELCINGKPVYLGTERSYTARRLTPNMEYTCTVCAITSEGRYESRPVTKRTAKDEYSSLNNPRLGAVLPLDSHRERSGPQVTCAADKNLHPAEAKGQTRLRPPVRALDCTCISDHKKPQSPVGLRPIPVASLCSLAPGNVLHQRAKTDSELVRLPPADSRARSVECETDTRLIRKKALQPMRDPLLRFRHRKQKLSSWDIAAALRQGEEKLFISCGKPTPITRAEENTTLAPLPIHLLRTPDSQAAGVLQRRCHTVAQFHPDLSLHQNPQSTERKVGKPSKAHRKGSEPNDRHKDALAWTGESGVPFRLPLTPNNVTIPQRTEPPVLDIIGDKSRAFLGQLIRPSTLSLTHRTGILKDLGHIFMSAEAREPKTVIIPPSNYM
ncbi:uncharacterized protein WCC33_015864 [Rhinophrynus dorsalis]